MEVHHHSHTSSPPAGRAGKKWAHYFWEFLMLFLAVFCGFLAEYKLEHKIEKDRADEYAELFLQDLKNDSIYVSQLLTDQRDMLAHADSLLTILSSDQLSDHNYQIVKHFTKLSVFVDFNPAFPVNFDQAKNSGSLRYIKDRKLIGSLSSLNRLMQRIQEVCKGYNDHIKQYLTPFSVEHLNTLQFDIFSRRVLVNNPDINNWNKEVATLLANKVNLKKTYDIFFINYFFADCNKKINFLIEELKKEDHLK